jgi:hypothetical protein
MVYIPYTLLYIYIYPSVGIHTHLFANLSTFTYLSIRFLSNLALRATLTRQEKERRFLSSQLGIEFPSALYLYISNGLEVILVVENRK